jgi:hypothetical protein
MANTNALRHLRAVPQNMMADYTSLMPAQTGGIRRASEAAALARSDDALAEEIKGKYRAISRHPLAIVDSREGGISGGRKAEFYPPEESHNPLPGRATVEVFDPAFQGQDFENLVVADFMHYLGKEDPVLSGLRGDFAQSVTPEQTAIDRRAYERAVSGEFGDPETRPYDEWYDVHRLDQYLGAPLLPEDSPDRADWMRILEPNQLRILAQMQEYLRTGM